MDKPTTQATGDTSRPGKELTHRLFEIINSEFSHIHILGMRKAAGGNDSDGREAKAEFKDRVHRYCRIGCEGRLCGEHQ